MSRAQSPYQYPQTAASEYEPGSGCLSGFLLPPICVLILILLLGNLALSQTPPSSSSIEKTISPIFTPEIQHWGFWIKQWADETGLDPNLIATVMQIESCGDPRAVSSSGALGLFQVMPFHFQPEDDPFDPGTNALRGLSYLVRSMESAHGNARLALAGYNGGIGVIKRIESDWSAQTRRYVQYGWPIYQQAGQATGSSLSLLEWHQNYGASLCRQAHRRLGLR
ncbi:MAG: lytic transglycosylase domain-containing protein [Chloroflexi bacterium]|nr:lytic transglycosylase domain-containing protein [Chloroflexota bacterium]